MSSVSSLNFCTESRGVLLQAGEVWYFVKRLSSVVAALLQIFALSPVAVLLALLSPPLLALISASL